MRSRPYNPVEQQALDEFQDEQFRAAVEKRKQYLREQAARPWWMRWWRYRVTITIRRID